MAAGTSVFLLWLVLRWDWLMAAGAYIIGGGCVLFVVGVVVLLGFLVRARLSRWFPRPRLRRMTVAAALLLLANFPAAAGVLVAVGKVESCYSVVIENHSPAMLEAVRVSGGGCEIDFGRLAPGAARRRWFWVQRTGELTLRAVSDGSPVVRMIDGYVTGGIGARTAVTVEPNGTISATIDYGRARPAW